MNLRTATMILMIGVLFLIVSAGADSIPVANHTFEYPVIDPSDNPNYAIPIIAQWREIDLDTDMSAFTGTFKNTPADSNDHIWNADGDQLALLWNLPGNSIEQELAATYQVGKSYQLTIATCLSTRFPPTPGSGLRIVFYYIYGTDFFEIDSYAIPVESVTTRTMRDFSFTIGPVEGTEQYAGKNIGIAIRPAAAGSGYGYWDIDNIRLMEFPRTPNFNDDSIVNLADFAEMASEWLSCINTTTDVTGDTEGCVNGADLLILAEYWLENV